jgi:LPS export ABC transporter protein LptC/lipopolysaccharide transport protein LptA
VKWQRRARIVIGIFAVAFFIFLVRAFRQSAVIPASGGVARTDPKALVETTSGTTKQYKFSVENIQVEYGKMFVYPDGTSKMQDVVFVTEERDGARGFTVRAANALMADRESALDLDGNVRLTSSDGVEARTERAKYNGGDGSVDAPGAVEFTKSKTHGTGIGLRYDKTRDVLTILDQAHVVAAAGENAQSEPASEVNSGSAAFARRDKYVQFDRDVVMARGSERMHAGSAIVRLTDDEKKIQAMELHGGARVDAPPGGAGSLKSLTGADMNLFYAAEGQTLQHAVIVGDAVIQVNGEPGKPGREIRARTIDIQLAPDGTTPVNLAGRDGVELTFPSEPGTPGRTVSASNLDATGAEGSGLSKAVLVGSVHYREKGGVVDRVATSANLELRLKPGMSTVDDARFTHAVRFEEGKMAAQAAAARYDVNKGTLELTGSEPGYLVPHVVNEQISVDAVRLDVTLEGPQVKASGAVKSMLLPVKKSDSKMPSMLKQDQPVNVVADGLAYDGDKQLATYTAGARLFQGSDTTIKADSIAMDQKRGDLIALGHAMTTTLREQTSSDPKKKKERLPASGQSTDFKYEDAARRLTYTGKAHLVGPEGEMTASKIELYLQSDSDEVDRAEAYTDTGEKMTLREPHRVTTGTRMTYTAEKETYLVTGLPAVVVDECGRETTGHTLTFVRSTDTILVDGNQQIRTQTKGGNGQCK